MDGDQTTILVPDPQVERVLVVEEGLGIEAYCLSECCEFE
jgi:hypothetical protein